MRTRHYAEAVSNTRGQLHEPSLDTLSGEPSNTIGQQVWALEHLYYAFEIVEVSTQTGRGLGRVVKDFFAFNWRLGLLRLRRGQRPSFDKWHRKIKLALLSSDALDTETTDGAIASAVSHTISHFHKPISEIRSS